MSRLRGARLPAPTSGARVLREVDFDDDIDALLNECRLGDLVLFTASYYRVAGVPNGVEQVVIESGYRHLLVLATTDLRRNALAHYRDAFAALECEYRVGEFRPLTVPHRILSLPFAMQVRPTDAGLPDAFSLPEGDWLLCRQWKSITVAWYQNKWWIADVDFGNGCAQVLSTYWRVWCPLRDLPAKSAPGDVTFSEDRYRRRAGALTRDLAGLVAAYRLTLKTWGLVALQFTLMTADTRRPHIIAGVESRLAECRWQFIDQPVQTVDDPDWPEPQAELTSMHAIGPLSTFRCDEWRTEPMPFCIDGMRDQWRVTVAGEPFVVDPRRHGLLGPAQDVSNNVPVAWGLRAIQYDRQRLHVDPQPVYQWRAVHYVVLEVTLALAPSELPSYVVLWVLEWLPALRHHVHIQVFRLIESILASRSRVLAARPST